jgi:hypothetical protein
MKQVEDWWLRVLTMKSSSYKYPAEINSLDITAQGIEKGRFSYDSVTDILTIIPNGKRFKVTDDGLVCIS